jgi:hypothetical protein
MKITANQVMELLSVKVQSCERELGNLVQTAAPCELAAINRMHQY